MELTDIARGRALRPLAGTILLALAVWAAGRLVGAEGLLALVEYVRSSGGAGVVVFAGAYVAATILLLPGALLTLGAGFLWGPFKGILIVSPVSVLAATTAFVLGRTLARDWIAHKIAASPRFTRVDEAVGREGARMVLLLRLSPLFPFSVLNYALGLTRVSLRQYVVASWIGMLPGTFLYLYLGSTVTTATELFSGAGPEAGVFGRLMYWTGLAATAVVTVLVTRLARRALNRTLEPPPDAPSGTPPGGGART